MSRNCVVETTITLMDLNNGIVSRAKRISGHFEYRAPQYSKCGIDKEMVKPSVAETVTKILKQ